MDKLISLIESVESLLAGFEEGDSDKKSHVAAVEAAIGWELPYEVRSFLVNTSSANMEEISPVFMGYELIDVKSLARMYKEPGCRDTGCCLFLFECASPDGKFVLGDDEGYTVIEDLEGEVEDGVMECDMKRIIPIMEASGFYIVLFYKSDHTTEIAVAAEDYTLSSLAPSLTAYLENLKVGVEKGVFEVDMEGEFEDGYYEIEAPESWKERVDAISY